MSPNHRRLHLTLVAQALAALTALACSATCLAADQNRVASSSARETTPGSWTDHKYRFNFMGFTSTYSCIGLGDKLRLVLQTSGARVQGIDYLCSRGFDRPDRLAQVEVRFQTLQPGTGASNGSAAASSSAGVWKRVEIAPHHPYDLQDGDCELVDQFRSTLLPMFAARNVHSKLNCVPHQDLGPFSLSFEVFAPAPAR